MSKTRRFRQFLIAERAIVVIFALLIAFGGLLASMMAVVNSDTRDILRDWEQFQTEKSEKVFVISQLQRQLGYGGMIHHFKNFILRGNLYYRNNMQEHIGAAIASLARYEAMGINEVERAALDDLRTHIYLYREKARQADELLSLGATTSDIADFVRLNDSNAIAALNTLSSLAFQQTGFSADTLSRSQVSSAFRAHIGFGGMIHHYKEYLLLGEGHEYALAVDSLELAQNILDTYTLLPLTEQEDLALSQLRQVLTIYGQSLEKIRQLRETMDDPAEIDLLVRIDDTPAIIALANLEQEKFAQDQANAEAVHVSVRRVEDFTKTSFWLIAALSAALILAAAWTMLDRRKRGQLLSISEARHRAIVENTVDAIIVIEPDGRIVEFNRSAERIFGFTADEVLDHNVSILMPESYAHQHDSFLANHLKTGEKKIIGIGREVVGRRKDGSEFPMDLAVSRLQMGDKLAFTGVVRDITKDKLAAAEILNAKIAAERANEAKSNFLATMSHEIRTPLNGIIGMAQLLRHETLNEKQENQVQAIYASGSALLAIINDVLDMSKIEAGRMEIEEVSYSPADLIDGIRMIYARHAEDTDITFACLMTGDKHPALLGDPARLRQILLNLVGNAFKFTRLGSITLTIDMQPATDRPHQVDLCISVTDTGIGIAPERLDSIFDAFTQEDSSITRRFGGSGLGLSIVKRLVGLMDGAISVDSSPGNGTRFDIVIPQLIDQSDDHDRTTPGDNPTGLPDRSLYVLIAEDNLVNAMVARSFLEKMGHTVTVAENGKLAVEALEHAQKTNSLPDLVFMDVHMPEMDGMEATEAIRAIPGLESLPILGLTAEAFEDRHKTFLACGMNAVLTKPFTAQQLRDAITRYVPIQQT